MNLSLTQIKLICFCMAFIMQESLALPTNYATLNRTQSLCHKPNKDKLVRIWMFFVGQGNSILIQIPEFFTGLSEPYDVLIDAEPSDKLAKSITRLYPEKTTIKNFVISHHDNDHVVGLSHLVKNADLSIEHVWHNGLVSFEPNAFNLTSDQLSSANLISKKNKKILKRFMGLVNVSRSGCSYSAKRII